MTDKIHVSQLTKQFEVRDTQNKGAVKQFTAIENMNFTIKEGEFLTIVGPSGCGKSTLLDLLGRIDRVDQYSCC